VKGDDGKSSIKWSSLDGNELNVVLEKLDLKAVLHDMQDKSLSTLDVLNKTSLVNICRERGLPITGIKDTLKNYLKDWMKKNGVSSLSPEASNIPDPNSNNSQACLIVALRANPEDANYTTPETFHHHARQWAINFRCVTFDEDVTPYIHVLVYHCHQFLEKYGVIHNLNCQPVENKTHLQSQAFHRGSQKGGRGHSYTLQVMERENRIMFARKHGLERKKRTYIHRKRALLGHVVPGDGSGEEEREEEEDPLVVREVEEDQEQDTRMTYRVFDEEEEEEG